MASALTASWMVILLSGAVALAALVPGVALMRRFGTLPFARVAEEAAGVVVGKAYGLAVTLLLVVMDALALRQFADTFDLSILPRTPVQVLVIVLALAAAYAAYAGLEGLSRITVFLTPWLLLALLGLGAAELRSFSVLRLFPLWGPGPGEVAGQSLARSSAYAEVLILFILYPYLRQPRRAVAVGIWSVLLSAALMVATQVVLVGIFDIAGADGLSLPLIHLSRMVALGRFVTRVEPLAVFVWSFAAVLDVTVLLWAAATTLAESLRLPDHRPLVAPLTAVTIGLALLPAGIQQASTLDFEYVRRWAWVVVFAIPAGLWVLAALRGLRGVPADEEVGADDPEATGSAR
ncbi:MAG: spore germination protein [Firmicutes bacterium]|nr:spore germination protein [Bacillota bacterium]